MSRYLTDVKHVHRGPCTERCFPPPEYAVSAECVAELRSEWQATTQSWLEKTDDLTAERWAETFAPEHPEWFNETTPEAT